MQTRPDQPPRLWPEQWATHASVEAGRLEHRMRVAQAASLDVEHKPIEEAVVHHLEAVRTACHRSGRRRWRGTRDRWRGTSVEQAYRNLHAAKTFLVDLLPEPDRDALVPEVSARLSTVLDPNDVRRTEAERMLRSADAGVRRAALRRAMEMSYDANDEEHSRVRNFRNIILLTAGVITVFTALLVIAVAWKPHAMPVCFRPGASSPATAQNQPMTVVCPSGERQTPSAGDVLIVAGLGALGGSLAALVAIRNLRGTSTPYDLPIALAVLKVPSGALTAVAGLLLLGGGFAPGFSDLDSQRQILAYALVLGYAQQILTRLVDERGQSVLNKIPSKDPEGRQPQPAPTGPLATAGRDAT